MATVLSHPREHWTRCLQNVSSGPRFHDIIETWSHGADGTQQSLVAACNHTKPTFRCLCGFYCCPETVSTGEIIAKVVCLYVSPIEATVKLLLWDTRLLFLQSQDFFGHLNGALWIMTPITV